jgi:isoleucyl-tRNA synthetase
MEEAWVQRFPDDSVHLHEFLPTPKEWADPALTAKWARLRELRKTITGTLELVRADKKIGSSLEADITLQVPTAADRALFDGIDLAELAITSIARVEAGGDAPNVIFRPAAGDKCARCWRVLEEVARRPDTHLCDRCTDAVRPA